MCAFRCDLRQVAIGRLLKLGVSVPEMDLISGHRTVSRLMRSPHLSAESLARKLNTRHGADTAFLCSAVNAF